MSLRDLIRHGSFPDKTEAIDAEVRRGRIVLMSVDGQSVKQIARELHLSTATVATWIKRFNADGIESLREKRHPGRPAASDPILRDRIIDIAQTPPRDLGLPNDEWTLDVLRDYCIRDMHMAVTRDLLFRTLRDVGWIGRQRRKTTRRPHRRRHT